MDKRGTNSEQDMEKDNLQRFKECFNTVSIP